VDDLAYINKNILETLYYEISRAKKKFIKYKYNFLERNILSWLKLAVKRKKHKKSRIA